jgi:hypothetical protein
MDRKDQQTIIQAAFKNLPASDAWCIFGRQILLTDTPCQSSRGEKRTVLSCDQMHGCALTTQPRLAKPADRSPKSTPLTMSSGGKKW